MIEYIRGKVGELTPTFAVIETHGVGYGLLISLNTFTAVQGKDEARLYVYESIREDAYVLYGFASRDERELFMLLLSVSGVGGQTSRMVLSAFTTADFVNIVQNEDVRSLKSVKGIGPKAAQRIIVELKDKVATLSASGNASTGGATGQAVTSAQKEVIDEAVQALAVLGFAPAPTQKVVVEIVRKDPSVKVEGIIKQALKML